jgi:hypothetical protein
MAEFFRAFRYFFIELRNTYEDIRVAVKEDPH